MLKVVVIIAVGILLVYGVSTLIKSPDAPASAGTGRVSSTVEIVPADAFANSTLQLRLANVAGAPGEVGVCRWFRNGNEITGVASSTLDPTHFHKGDKIEAETTLEGAAARAPAVTILNTPPHIVAASTTLHPDPSAQLYAQVSAVDADNDPITYHYTWFVDGKKVAGETGPTLNVSRLQKNEKVYAEVVATDGENECAPVVADRIQIGSTVPAITSVPPQTLQEGGRFVYQVNTSMPESKSLRFTLVKAPDGMTIDRGGRIEWVVPGTAQPQGYDVEVRVSDFGGGEASQSFEISTAPPDSTKH